MNIEAGMPLMQMLHEMLSDSFDCAEPEEQNWHYMNAGNSVLFPIGPKGGVMIHGRPADLIWSSSTPTVISLNIPRNSKTGASLKPRHFDFDLSKPNSLGSLKFTIRRELNRITGRAAVTR